MNDLRDSKINTKLLYFLRAAAGVDPNNPVVAGLGAAVEPNNPPVEGAGAVVDPNNPPDGAGAFSNRIMK